MSDIDAIVEADQGHFEELGKLEKEFDKVEIELLRENSIRYAPLFARRNEITTKITRFWPLVLETAAGALGFDEHITPEDAHLIATSLNSINVTRPDAQSGDPRNILITFEFSENQWFEDKILEKKFTHQGGDSGGLTGLVSEPVAIKWKSGKDLTGGVTELAVKAFEERRKAAEKERGEGKKGKGVRKRGEMQERLLKALSKERQSFFNWFGWTGKHISLGEAKGSPGDDDSELSDDEDDEVDEDSSPVDSFPFGDEIAVQIADDMYPNAPKYFVDTMEEPDPEDSDDDEEIDLDSDLEEQLAKNGVALGASSKGKSNSKRNGNADDEGPAKKKARK
ncbi:hypothetical protein RUND412_002297 [Rhizina undulata]